MKPFYTTAVPHGIYRKAGMAAKYIQSKIGGDIDDIIRVLPGRRVQG